MTYLTQLFMTFVLFIPIQWNITIINNWFLNLFFYWTIQATFCESNESFPLRVPPYYLITAKLFLFIKFNQNNSYIMSYGMKCRKLISFSKDSFRVRKNFSFLGVENYAEVFLEKLIKLCYYAVCIIWLIKILY